MKNIYKVSLALVASLLLVPAVFAQETTPIQYQHETYKLENGVGFNKYLVSNSPNEKSEYTLRLETFVTGGVKATAIPTDFVIVLDASGSMKYDYRIEGLYPPMNDAAAAATWTKLWPYFLHEPGNEYTAFTVGYTFADGAVGSTGSGTVASTSNPVATRSYYRHFRDENVNHTCSLFYHYQDGTSNDGYYKIFRRMFDASDGHLLEGPEDPGASTGWKKYSSENHSGSTTNINNKPATVQYNLAIKLKDGTYKYLNGSGLSDTRYNATAVGTIMFRNDGNIYRLKRRGEALVDGVEGFVNLIAAENAKDQWAENIPAKHQIAIVRFSGDYPSGGASITPPTGYSIASHVMFGFTEVTGASEAATFISTFENKYIISGSTYTDYGMNLARLLLQDLQTKEGGKYAALNSGGGVNRNKVVVFFTDGEPSNSAHSGGSSSFFGTVQPTLEYGKTIKKVGVGQINGRVYTIDLAMSTSTKDFLKHLSSNYPKGGAKVISGSYAAANLEGAIVPIDHDQYVGEGKEFSEEEYKYLKDETPIYYKDSNDGDLTSVFSSIAEGNTGQQAGEKLVVMDVMSDSFELPANLSGKVKFYTAQCIGTKQIDGEEYLAFAREIPVDDRLPLAHLWVGVMEGEGDAATLVWHDRGDETHGGLDIDQEIRAKKSANGKSITVSGFEFVDLWCGKDEVIGHNNNTRQMDADDPNAAYAADGYRGFKLIIEFPIIVSDGALGGTGVPTNNEIQSGFYHGQNDGTATGDPIINYQKPELTIPVQLAIKKQGLGVNESASFTVQRRTKVDGSEWEDYLTFVLTCTATVAEPIQKLLNLSPDYYYRVKENGWAWAYSNRAQVEATFPSTEDPNLSNPIVIVNTPNDDTPKHAEAVVRNELKNY